MSNYYTGLCFGASIALAFSRAWLFVLDDAHMLAIIVALILLGLAISGFRVRSDTKK